MSYVNMLLTAIYSEEEADVTAAEISGLASLRSSQSAVEWNNSRIIQVPLAPRECDVARKVARVKKRAPSINTYP